MSALALRERLQRRVIPRAVVGLSTVRFPRRWAAAVQRALGGRGLVRLYVAFDDPYGAIALLALADRLQARRVRLRVEPVVARGIPGDPAVDAKRRYAVHDARRLARRTGRELRRTEPVSAEACAFLGEWAAALPAGRRVPFCLAALERLWFGSDGPVAPEPYAHLHRQAAGRPPTSDGRAALRRCERSMRRRRLYDTPVAVVAGQWFFAHERIVQIEHRLDELGWRATA